MAAWLGAWGLSKVEGPRVQGLALNAKPGCSLQSRCLRASVPVCRGEFVLLTAFAGVVGFGLAGTLVMGVRSATQCSKMASDSSNTCRCGE